MGRADSAIGLEICVGCGCPQGRGEGFVPPRNLADTSFSPSAWGGGFLSPLITKVKRLHIIKESAFKSVKCQGRSRIPCCYTCTPAPGPVRYVARRGLEGAGLPSAPAQLKSRWSMEQVLQGSRQDAPSQPTEPPPDLGGPPDLHLVESGLLLEKLSFLHKNPKQTLNQRRHSG